MRRILVACLIAVAALVVVPAGQPGGGRPAPPSKTALILLGTGTPVPDPAAWGPASAVVVGDRLFLVDAGAGVTRRLAAAGFPRVKDVAATFLTHLHSDHTLGYPDLIFTTWLMGRRVPLAVYGPGGLREMTDRIMEAWHEELDVRVKGLERETRAYLRVETTEIAPGVVYDHSGVKVTAVRVPHGDLPSFAYRFDTADRSIVFSGDTNYSDNVVTLARGADILVHEVVSREFWERPGAPQPPAVVRHILASHTDAADVGRVATAAGVGTLVLNHYAPTEGPNAPTDDQWLAAVRQTFKGRIVLGKDLMEL
jgi:ribonuclease Z